MPKMITYKRIWPSLLLAPLFLGACMKFDINASAFIGSESTPPPALTPGSTVVSRWEFENTWMDSVGTSHGTAVSPTTPTFTTTKLLGAAAADLSSADARVDIGTSSDLTPTNLTVSFWLRRTGPSGITNVIMWTKPCSGGWSDPTGFYIAREGNHKAITLVVSGGNLIGVDDDPDVVFPLNTWSHVAVTFDSTLHEGHIYINGVDQPLLTHGTNPQVIQPAVGNSKFIGSCDVGSSIDWPLDELTVINGVLSQSEITTLYQTQKTAAGI